METKIPSHVEDYLRKEVYPNAPKKQPKRNKAILVILSVVFIILAMHFLCVEPYTVEMGLAAFCFICCATGCVIAFGIETDKTNKPSKN